MHDSAGRLPRLADPDAGGLTKFDVAAQPNRDILGNVWDWRLAQPSAQARKWTASPPIVLLIATAAMLPLVITCAISISSLRRATTDFLS